MEDCGGGAMEACGGGAMEDPSELAGGALGAPSELAGGALGASSELAGGALGAPSAPLELAGGALGAPSELAGGALGAPSAPLELAAGAQTERGGDGVPVAPASKAPGGAREGILEMASSSDGASLAQRPGTAALQTGALGLATLGAAMDRERHGDPPTAAGHLADAPALGTAPLEPDDQGLHTPGALDAVEPPTDASAEAWARELLPTVPHPATHYNLPVLHVQRY
jgi:hypothetical protein